jgi:hypothetical protein
MSLTAVIGGLAHMVLNGPTVPYVFNTVWAAYHAATMSVLFAYLNRPVTIAEREPLFAIAALPTAVTLTQDESGPGRSQGRRRAR